MKTKKIILDLLTIILILTLIGCMYYLFINRNNYHNVEKEMIEKAKEYVIKNNIKVENQEYVFLNDINVKNTELCLKTSGVIVTKVDDEIKYTPYLRCSDYESKIINNDNTYIELEGNAVDLVKKGSIYLDPGFKKNKNVKVVTVGDVLDEIGAYTINYVVKENNVQVQVLKRIVIVSDYDNDLVEFKEEPTITLNGEENMLLTLSEEYIEPGFEAYDLEDEDLTSQVKIDNKIDTKKLGTYKINYSVTNSKGKSANASRTIKVVKKKADLQISSDIYKEDNETFIKLTISGDGFKSVVLPNHEANNATINTYKITENGKYVFKIIDTYDNEFYKTIIIDSIDNEAPAGECAAFRGEKDYTVKVNAKDNVGIKGIIYIINDNSTGLFSSYQYKTIEIVEKAEVVLVDLSDNKTTITCKIND